MLPVIGLSFSNHPACADHAALKEVLKTFADNGGRVFDVMHVNPAIGAVPRHGCQRARDSEQALLVDARYPRQRRAARPTS